MFSDNYCTIGQSKQADSSWSKAIDAVLVDIDRAAQGWNEREMDVMPISPDSDSFFSGSKAFLRKLSPNIEMHSRNILIILFLIARLSYSFPVAVPTSSMVPKEVDQRLMIALQASNEDETPTNKADELFEVPSNGSLSKDDSSEDIDNVLDTNGVSIQCQTDCSGGKTDAQVENGMNVCESLPKSNGEIEILGTSHSATLFPC